MHLGTNLFILDTDHFDIGIIDNTPVELLRILNIGLEPTFIHQPHSAIGRSSESKQSPSLSGIMSSPWQDSRSEQLKYNGKCIL